MIDGREASLYSIGKGAAQVWGPNKALGLLQATYQQDQLRKQKEDAEMQEQLSKLNYSKARPEDTPELQRQYGDITTKFAQYRGSQDKNERNQIMSDINQKKMNLLQSVSLSQKAAQQLHDIGQLRMQHPDEISDEFVPQYKTISGLSTFDPKFKDQADNLANTALIPKFDTQGYNKKLLTGSIEQVNGGPVLTDHSGGLNRKYQNVGSQLNADNVLNNTLNAYNTDRSFRRMIDTNYKGIPHDDAVKQYAANLYTANKDAYNKVLPKTVATQWDQRQAPMTSFEEWKIAHGYDPTKQQQGGKPTFWQDKINSAIDGEPGSGEYVSSSIVSNLAKNNQSFVDGKRIQFLDNKDKGTKTLTIPAIQHQVVSTDETGKTKSKTVIVKPAQSFTYDPKDRDGAAKKFTDILNIYGGERIPYSKQFTPSGKGKLTGTPADNVFHAGSQQSSQNNVIPSTGKKKIKNF